MRIFVKGGNHLEITSGMRAAIEEKLSMLNKFLKEDEKVSITVTSVKKELKVSILFIYNNKPIKIVEKGTDFYYILDKLENVLKIQMEKKHSLKVKQRKDQEKAFENFESFEFLQSDNMDIEDETYDLPPIVKEKYIPSIPMTEIEARKQMKENGYDTFIFINADRKNAYCSLYTRNDGSNGLMIISE